MLVAGLFVLTLSGACASAPGAATTWETAAYRVVIPDDLGLAPLNRDPVFVWAHPEISYVGTTADRALTVSMDPITSCTTAAVLDRATVMFHARPLTDLVQPGAVSLAAGTAAMWSGKQSGIQLSFVVVCSGSKSAWVLGWGLTSDELLAILRGFSFRDPPGDPVHPPPSSS